MRENPPATIAYDQLLRNILADQPRVTRFPIAWTRELPPPELPPVEGNPDEEPAEFEVSANMDMEDGGQGTSSSQFHQHQQQSEQNTAPTSTSEGGMTMMMDSAMAV